MTLDCVRPTQSSVIQIIHRNVGLKCFSFNFTKMFVTIVTYAYIIYISQGLHIYHVVGYIIITLLQIVCRVCQ